MKKVGLILILALVTVLILTWTGGHLWSKDDIVYIGYIGPLTGGAAYLGQSALNGALMAAEEINAAGGITVGGKKYQLKIEKYDDEATPAKAVAGLKKLKDQYEIPMVIANVSGSAMAITEINEKLDVLWAGFAKHPDLTTKGNKLVLQSVQHTVADAKQLGDGALEVLKAKTFATLCDTGDYGRQNTDHFTKYMQAKGATLVAAEWFDMRTDHDFRVQITKIKAKNPDTIFIAAYDEATGQVIKQCRELGLNMPLVLTQGFQSLGRQITGPERIEGCINILSTTNMVPPPPAVQRYRELYQKKHKTPPASYGENNFELVYIVAKGMEKAGSLTEAIKIKEGMRQVVPVDPAVRTYYIEKWDENGVAKLWTRLGIYKNGQLTEVK